MVFSYCLPTKMSLLVELNGYLLLFAYKDVAPSGAKWLLIIVYPTKMSLLTELNGVFLLFTYKDVAPNGAQWHFYCLRVKNFNIKTLRTLSYLTIK